MASEKNPEKKTLGSMTPYILLYSQPGLAYHCSTQLSAIRFVGGWAPHILDLQLMEEVLHHLRQLETQHLQLMGYLPYQLVSRISEPLKIIPF